MTTHTPDAIADLATSDARILVLMRVSQSGWPTFADHVLLNVARHLAGDDVATHTLADTVCGRCTTPLDLTTWRDEHYVDYCCDQCRIDCEGDR